MPVFDPTRERPAGDSASGPRPVPGTTPGSPRGGRVGNPSGGSRWRSIAAVAFVLIAVAAATAFVVREYGRGASLASYVRSIEQSLHAREAVAAGVLADTAFLQQQVYGLSRLPREAAARHAERLGSLTEEAFNIALYEEDTLVFWVNNLAILPRQLSPRRLPPQSLRALENGQYLIKRERLRLFGNRDFDAVTLLPIRREYALNSAYLRDGFVGAPRVSDAVGLVKTPTAFGLRARNGETIAYLTRLRAFNDWRYQAWMFGLHFCGVVAVSLLLFRLSTMAKRRYGALAGVASILSGAFLLQRLMASNNLSKLYPDLGFLAELFDVDLMSGSLASFVVRVVLAMWLVTYFHRSYRGWRPEGRPPLVQWVVTAGHYLAIVAAAAALTLVVESTIKSPGIDYDFVNVLNLSRTGMVALIAMLTLVFAHFLFSHRIMLGISEIGLSKQARVTALLAAVATAVPFLALVGLPLPLPHFLLGAAAFILVYDLFIDTGESNILWLFFWLVILSIYSAALFFTFNEQKDLSRRLAYAKELADPHDRVAERELLAFDSTLRRDIEVQNLLLATPAEEFRARVTPPLQRLLIERGYLYNNYKLQVRVAAAAGLPDGGEDLPDPALRFGNAEPVSSNVRLDLTTTDEPAYLLRLTSNPRRDYAFEAFLEVRVGPRAPSKFLSELLINEPYRGLEHLREYEYAVYRNNVLIQSQGGTPTSTLLATNVPAPGGYRTNMTSRYAELLYAAPGHTIAYIGKDMGGYVRPLSLFSYLFVWCIILTLVMSLVNTWIDILPEAVDISWLSKPDLKTKIQVGIIALVLLSFAMIGYVTVLYFHDSTDAYHDNRLSRKVTSILENVEHEIALMSQMGEVNLERLGKIIKPMSRIHSMDVNLFGLDGRLAAASEREVFNRGVVAPLMGAFARQLLAERGSPVAQQMEGVGSLRYRTAYVPVRAVDGQTIAYMGLPYYSKQRDLRDDVSEFMGTLLNVYVFLLLIAGVIAITVANSITRPLTELGDKIRRFKVDDQVQPLEWRAKDELGDLIHEFNTMLSTVESSAKELDLARREMAWREMAQQVAHEIKNPLTPMRLSIEFLRHANQRNPDPEALTPLIERTSATVIEQIENLTSIATNFSTFARMPEPENSELELDELVTSVAHLFLEERADLSLAIDRFVAYPVYADKKLLGRVLTNLIKNALQAIPDEREARVAMSLERVGETAVICVADNGTGIPADMQEKVFFPKFTTKSSGSGLGLAICRDIVQAAGGRIYFETALGEGTRFYVELPIGHAPPEPFDDGEDDEAGATATDDDTAADAADAPGPGAGDADEVLANA